jgi:hypothetical protein
MRIGVVSLQEPEDIAEGLSEPRNNNSPICCLQILGVTPTDSQTDQTRWTERLKHEGSHTLEHSPFHPSIWLETYVYSYHFWAYGSFGLYLATKLRRKIAPGEVSERQQDDCFSARCRGNDKGMEVSVSREVGSRIRRSRARNLRSV